MLGRLIFSRESQKTKEKRKVCSKEILGQGFKGAELVERGG